MLPDLGMAMRLSDEWRDAEHHFTGLSIDRFYVVDEATLSFCANTSGGEFCLSVDVGLAEGLRALRESGVPEVVVACEAVSLDPWTPRAVELGLRLNLDAVCRIGEPVQTMHEVIAPFLASRVSVYPA